MEYKINKCNEDLSAAFGLTNNSDNKPHPLLIPEHDTEPSHHSPVNPKIYPLLIEEEEIRRELNANIDYLLKEDCQPSNTKHLLQAFKNYMSGIKELTDIVKQGHG